MPGQQPRVLVVGGDSHDRAKLVEELGASAACRECTNAAEAHLCLRRARFDVIVFHVSPDSGNGGDGTEMGDFVSSLCERPKVVLVSEDPEAEWVRYAFKRGAFDVVMSWSNVAEIVRSVDHAIAAGATVPQVTVTGDDRESSTDSVNDPLTEALTQRAFHRSLERLRARCRTQDQCMSVLILDIDDFRGFNEVRSRRAGDGLLRWFSRQLRRFSSDADSVGRYDADRFAVALHDADENHARRLAERIRREVSGGGCLGVSGGSLFRFRIGVATSQSGFVESADDLVERALIAAERAKDLGGNQTVCWSDASVKGPSRRRLEQASIDEVSRWIGGSRQQLRQGYIESTQALVAAVEAKEPHTREHARVVSVYCEEIAGRMDLPTAQIESIKTAALLHDVGKIGVPDSVLQKPGPLTEAEFAMIKKHPQIAVDILGHASFLRNELPLILHHHERFDGRGYPGGLRGSKIPLGARVLNVADSLDAMLSARSYKSAFSVEHVRSELRRCSGGQFDDEVARVALEWLEDAPNETAQHDHAGVGSA